MTNKLESRLISLLATSQGHSRVESAGTSAHCLGEQELTTEVSLPFEGGPPPPEPLEGGWLVFLQLALRNPTSRSVWVGE